MNQAMRAEQHQSTTGASAIHGHGDHIDPQNRSHIDALNQRHSDGGDADRGSGDQNNRDPLGPNDGGKRNQSRRDTSQRREVQIISRPLVRPLGSRS